MKFSLSLFSLFLALSLAHIHTHTHSLFLTLSLSSSPPFSLIFSPSVCSLRADGTLVISLRGEFDCEMDYFCLNSDAELDQTASPFGVKIKMISWRSTAVLSGAKLCVCVCVCVDACWSFYILIGAKMVFTKTVVHIGTCSGCMEMCFFSTVLLFFFYTKAVRSNAFSCFFSRSEGSGNALKILWFPNGDTINLHCRIIMSISYWLWLSHELDGFFIFFFTKLLGNNGWDIHANVTVCPGDIIIHCRPKL